MGGSKLVMIRRGMKMLELDRYLSFMVRRIRPYLATKYSTDIIRSLQRFYAQCYADDRSPWTVMCDFDGDLRLKIDRSSFIGSSIYWNGYSSLNELYLLGRLLEPHMVFVDVGANQGEFTLYAAKRLPAGKVLAFEPVEERYRHLIENVQMNGLENICAYNVGLSDYVGEFEMYMPQDIRRSNQTFNGLANEGTASVFRSSARPSKACTARLETFDRVFRESGLSRLDVIKIDVEGAELHVLRGARDAIDQYRPAIIMEMSAESLEAAGHTTGDVIDFLDNLHYELFLIGNYRSIDVWKHGFTGRYGRLTQIDRHNIPDYCNIMCRYVGSRQPVKAEGVSGNVGCARMGRETQGGTASHGK